MAALADAAQLLAAKGLLKSKTLMAVFRGSKCREAAEADLEAHDVFGAGRAVELSDAHRLLHRAFERGVLEETVAANKFGGLQATLRLGPSFSAARREAFAMQVVAGTRGTGKAARKLERDLAEGGGDGWEDVLIFLIFSADDICLRFQRNIICIFWLKIGGLF